MDRGHLPFHRLRINEALGREESETEADRRWLSQHGVPIVDQLF